MLDTQLKGTTRNLVLYAIPDYAYEIQLSYALDNPGVWSDFMPVAMTNLMLVIPNSVGASNRILPRLSVECGPAAIAGLPGRQQPLPMVFGLTGTNYTLQVTSNLSDTIRGIRC